LDLSIPPIVVIFGYDCHQLGHASVAAVRVPEKALRIVLAVTLALVATKLSFDVHPSSFSSLAFARVTGTH
jgi:hypothetical protein